MSDGIVRLTRQQVREVDRRAIEQYHVPGIVLMENAAIHASELAWKMVGRNPDTFIDIVCGGGNNGGDGLAIARHLINRGAMVSILLAVDPDKYTGDALINWRITQAMQIPTWQGENALFHAGIGISNFIVDALFGTGLTQPPRPEAATWIELMNQRNVPKLAVDVPSGLDCDTGRPPGACVRATKTVTFVAEKAGFANPESREYTGDVVVADIGCPDNVLRDILHDMATAPATP
jgi:NAD(P)H-hydrate epimerase